MTDADLNALFAEKVAGLDAKTIQILDGSLANPGPGINFTASMDAVLPYLEKWIQAGFAHGPEIKMTANNEWRVELFDGMALIASIEDKSLPRACVLALLRAKGVQV